MKRFLALALMLMMLLTCTAMAEVNPKGVLPVVTEPITLTIAMPVDTRVEDIDTNQLTLWIEEQCGVNLEFLHLSTSDTATQINLMFVAGTDLPDMVWNYNFDYATMCEYVDAGHFIPLTEYVEEYGEYFQHALETSGIADGIAQISYDGDIYTMPTTQISSNSMYCQYRLNYQTQFTEALGIEEPKTLEEFYDFLVKVRDEDVNGNGDPNDEIPMTGYADEARRVWDIIGTCFQYTNSNNFFKMNGDTVEFVANNDLYKETVEFVKKMVDEGLYDPAAWTQSKEDLIALNTQEDPIVGALSVGWMITQCYDTTAYDYYTCRSTDPLIGPYGYQATRVTYPTFNHAMFITSACENPEAAYRVMDFMLSPEAFYMARYGKYGEQYTDHDRLEGKFMLIGAQEWSNPSTNKIWDVEAMLYQGGVVRDTFGNTFNEEFGDYAPNHYMISVKGNEVYPLYATQEELPYLNMDVDMAIEYQELQTLIVNYVREQSCLFALGDRPMEQWDDYCAELEAMGVARYLELAQEAYNNTYGA